MRRRMEGTKDSGKVDSSRGTPLRVSFEFPLYWPCIWGLVGVVVFVEMYVALGILVWCVSLWLMW